MSEVVTIGEVAKVRSGFAFKSTDWQTEGIPVIKIANVKDGAIAMDGCSYVNESVAAKAREFELVPGDIVISMTGYIGEVAKVRDEGRILLNQRVGRFAIRDAQRLDAEYFYQYLRQPEVKKTFADHAYGAAQPNISPSLIEQQTIILPDLPTQRRIAGILSAYDELIANNQRRIAILEEMARALYREWFVHYRFPAEGSAKAGAPGASAEASAKAGVLMGEDGVPEGWEVKPLGSIVENFDRKRRPLSKMQRAEMQGEYPYYGAAKVFDYVNDYIFDGEYLLLAEDGSVINPDRSPVLQLVNEKFWPNNHTHILSGKKPVSTHFLYLALLDVDVSPYITGAAQPKITQENMNRIPIVCGPAEVHAAFDHHVAPMIEQCQVLQRQSANLRRTRDLLLPRLMSGRVEMGI